MKKEEIQNEEVSSEKDPEVTPEKPQDDLSPQLKDLEEKNKQLFERAKKAEDKLKEAKPPVEDKPEEEPKAPSQDNNPRDIARLAKTLGEYSDEEVDFIYSVAKDGDIDSIVEATKNPMVITAIQSTREKVAKEDKIPEPGKVTSEEVSKGMTYEGMQEDPDSHREAFKEAMRTGKTPGEGI